MTIDVKPGSVPNSINPKSHGVTPVAILTTATFDATMVDPSSVRFGPNEVRAAKSHVEDVDGDGNLDRLFHFRTQETGIQCGNRSVLLTGETFSGHGIEGAEPIVTVGCK